MNYIRSIIHALMNTLPVFILKSFFSKLMLGGLEICAEILDEGFESERIQQVAHGCLAGFEFLVGYDEHGGTSFFILFHKK